VDLETWIGRVEGLEDSPIEGALADYDCRNNRLGMAALEQDGFMEAVAQARSRYGAARIGVFLGTSTSGVLQTEEAYARANPDTGELPDDYIYRTTQNIYSIASFTREVLQLEGPALVVSTACSSSAKVFATAWRHMQAGLCDAAIVGGVDSLCRMTLYGFNALQLVSSKPCRPADRYRDGINIGEAGGYALLEWADEDSDICLLGYGESSDAYHMSSPHPEGRGAALAMQQALQSAGLKPDDVDYINLHGTATPANDRSEDKGLMQVFGGKVPCSSTKGFTGHTLGAAGILEAIIACIAIEEGMMPPSVNTDTLDEEILSPVVLSPQRQSINCVLSNSFGFGGSNASLVIGRLSA
jgi:3-oxoacyl-[acyl-carrier-protein] synthase-1